MAEAFVELGAEGVNHITEKHFDKIYDKVNDKVNKGRGNVDPGAQDDYGGAASAAGRRKQQNRLPSPDGGAPVNWQQQQAGKENVTYSARRRDSQRSSSLDRESEVSERVLRRYESERDDPSRKAESVLSKQQLRHLNNNQQGANMSYANGYPSGGTNLGAPPSGYDDRRANSQQPPRSRYYDDDDSDYDERSGRRYRTTGRGYDDGYDDDRGYDREVVETERYRGVSGALVPARDFDGRRASYGTTRSGNEAGAMTQYRRSGDVDDYKSQRSRSRGRRYSEKERDRSRSYSDSRSRSRSRSLSKERGGGIRGKLDDTFDTSMKGLGVGLAGAVVGGLAGREFGHKHKNRDIIIGALIGGLGANAAENKWHNYKEEKEDKLRRDEDRFEQRWDGRGDVGRSRSSMR